MVLFWVETLLFIHQTVGAMIEMPKILRHWLIPASELISLAGSHVCAGVSARVAQPLCLFALEMQAQCGARRAREGDDGGGWTACVFSSLQGRKVGTRFPSKPFPAHGTVPRGLEFEIKFDWSLNFGKTR